MKNGDKAAFGHEDNVLRNRIGRGLSEIDYLSITKGLTKREYFAGLAMQARFNAYLSQADYEMPFESLARDSVMMADELLKQLEGH